MSEEASSPAGDDQPKPVDKVDPPAQAAGESPVAAVDEPARKADNIGREYSARAAQPGMTGGRLDTERDAWQSFGHSAVNGGTAIGRDQHNTYTIQPGAADADRRFSLPAPDIDEITAYVDPAGFEQLLKAVQDERVVILRAARDQGKYAAARRLLLSDSRGLFGLRTEAGLSGLSGVHLAEGGGHILADLPVAAAKELTMALLTELRSVLESRQARLVITVTAGCQFADPGISELVVNFAAAHDRVAIVHCRLTWRLGEADTATVLADPEVEDLVGTLAGEGPPREAMLVADLLARAFRERRPLAASVREAVALRGEEKFEDWFESLPDLPTQCLAVAVAVLGGEPYETVSSAATLLQRRLEPETPREDTEPSRLAPLRAVKRTRLRTLYARVEPSKVGTRHGADAPTEVVRYVDPAVPKRVLLYFWAEYDAARPQFLNWLRRCATHDMDSARVRVAVATGILASRVFDYVRANVISPWAHDADARLRHAAAQALRVAAREPGLREAVRDLVRTWSREEDNPRLRATAALAWGVEFDAAGIAASLSILAELSDTEDLEVVLAVCDAITEMWEFEGVSLEAPELLLSWIRGRSTHRRTAARLAFMLASADLIRDIDAGSEGPATWPGLLHIAALDPVRQREIAELWRDALTAPGLHHSAKDILATWARQTERFPTMRRCLVRLLTEAAADDRTKKIIRLEAGRWSQGPRSAPLCSAEVLQALAAQ
ncbi:MAG: hypothetical protein ABIS86_18005 [Streptosporangiaceae bacterium]